MSEVNSTESTRPNKPTKPSKPTPDYPLTPHPTGRWCKKIAGSLHYFGRWENPTEALKLYNDFLAGKPRPKKKSRRRGHHQFAKPYADFPLTAHPSGRWCKKILNKIHYFGPIADHEAALSLWLLQKDDLLAGRVPREKQPDGLTLRDLVIAYLRHKKALVTSGELSQRTFDEYHRTCERLLNTFGKERLAADLVADDFERLRAETAKVWGPTRLGNEIVRVRGVFKYGYDADLIDRPIKFGPAFKRPSLKTLRKQRATKGQRMFQAAEIHAMLDAAEGQLRAMLLLGINCAFGNEDIARLPMSAIDLKSNWVTFPRPKTGTERRCKLWPQTAAALQDVLANRKPPKDPQYAKLVFITKYGKPWANGSYGTALTHEMDKVLAKLKMKRPGLSFYALRHTFRTIADGSRDRAACDFIMGHVDSSMAGSYIEKIDNSRLEVVAAHVHAWLFPPPAGGTDRAIAGRVG